MWKFLARVTVHTVAVLRFFLERSIMTESKIYWQRVGVSEKKKKLINCCFWFLPNDDESETHIALCFCKKEGQKYSMCPHVVCRQKIKDFSENP